MKASLRSLAALRDYHATLEKLTVNSALAQAAYSQAERQDAISRLSARVVGDTHEYPSWADGSTVCVPGRPHEDYHEVSFRRATPEYRFDVGTRTFMSIVSKTIPVEAKVPRSGYQPRPEPDAAVSWLIMNAGSGETLWTVFGSYDWVNREAKKAAHSLGFSRRDLRLQLQK